MVVEKAAVDSSSRAVQPPLAAETTSRSASFFLHPEELGALVLRARALGALDNATNHISIPKRLLPSCP